MIASWGAEKSHCRRRLAVLLFGIALFVLMAGCNEKNKKYAIDDRGDKVDYIRQQDELYCVPACMQSLLLFEDGICLLSQQQIFNQCNPGPGGVSFYQARKWLNTPGNSSTSWGFILNPFWDSYLETISLVVRYNDPPMVPLNTTHSVIVAGYTHPEGDNTTIKNVILMNPAQSGDDGGFYSLEQWYWHDMAPKWANYYGGIADDSHISYWPTSSSTEAMEDSLLIDILGHDYYSGTGPGGDPMDDIPFDDGSGCQDCPPPDTMDMYFRNLAVAYLMEYGPALAPVVEIFGEEWYNGAYVGTPRDFISQIELLPMVSQFENDDKPRVGNLTATTVQPIGVKVVPFINSDGFEMGYCIFVNGMGYAYCGLVAKAPPGFTMAKEIPNGYIVSADSKPNEGPPSFLMAMAKRFTDAWQTDPESICFNGWGKNVHPAEWYLTQPDVARAINFFEWSPYTRIQPEWGFIRVEYVDGTRKTYDVKGREYIRANDGYLIAAKVESPVADLSGNTESGGFPAAFELSQNYPNPFNASTVIKFTLANAGYVRLDVYNSLGQHISTTLDEFMSAGVHRVEFNSGSLPSGMYFCRLNAGGASESKKMLLMK